MANDRHREQWENLGASDPYWAVLSQPSKRHGRWEPDEFFEIGHREIRAVLRTIQDLEVPLGKKVALDFGCGVGRLSRALAGEFEKVIAIDVSTAMLDEARNANRQIDNIEFVHNSVENLDCVANESIDLVCSKLVLQHMPRVRQQKFISAMCDSLVPGGVLTIQVAAAVNLRTWQGWMFRLLGNRVLNLLRYVRYGRAGIMEVHALPERAVRGVLAAQGMDILSVQPDGAAGRAFSSLVVYARKPELTVTA
ncbi:MAG: class I SAM-dependent methyltransferase [Pseudomonadota bacterium]